MKFSFALALLLAVSGAVNICEDEKEPAAARCIASQGELSMDVKVRSWLPKPKTMDETRFGAKYNPPAPSTSSNIMTASFMNLPSFKPTYAFFKDSCDGNDLQLEDHFEIEAGSTRVMQKTDITSLVSLTGGSDSGPLAVELRNAMGESLACCTFKLEESHK
eukprot:CAMPEP_0170458378 /NCGR_PEP_ID=MMETSP0123-20130129/5360_1 /TAXON_ID=182087 /ORGANISM="Favella ehrenbergii, Strain Fehren 1" /LENGTH=161 /DNA_ID=CAMNT_0010722491 /DNA_START=19 /DNA_END=504 /DNA_ORIENTATION=+